MFEKHLNKHICYINDGDSSKEASKESSKESMSLNDAILEATKELETETEKETKTPEKDLQKTPKQDKPKDKEEDPKESDEEQLDPEEAKKAVALLRAINDPATSREVISLLAKQVGLTSESTKSEQKEAVKTLKDMFKESLGPDLEFMSDKLYDAVEKISNSIAETKTKDIKDRFEASEKEARLEKLDSSYEKVMSEYSNSKELVSEIIKLQDLVSPKPGMSPDAYFKMLLVTAAANKDVTLVKNSSEGTKSEKKDSKTININLDKLNKARNDANSRIASERSEEGSKSSPPQVRNLKDAIAQAVELVEAGQK